MKTEVQDNTDIKQDSTFAYCFRDLPATQQQTISMMTLPQLYHINKTLWKTFPSSYISYLNVVITDIRILRETMYFRIFPVEIPIDKKSDIQVYNILCHHKTSKLNHFKTQQKAENSKLLSKHYKAKKMMCSSWYRKALSFIK